MTSTNVLQSSATGRRSSSLLIATAAFITASVSDRVYAQNSNADHPADLSAEQVLRAIKNARSSLKSGVFRATGLRHDDPAGEIASEFECFCAFDNQLGLFRFDTDGVGFASIATTSQLPAGVDAPGIDRESLRHNARQHRMVSRILWTPELSTDWSAIGDSVDSDHATSHLELKPPPTPLLGLCSAVFLPETAGLFEYRNRGITDTFDEIVRRYEERSTHKEVIRASESEYRLVFWWNRQAQRVISINPRQEYTVTRMTFHGLDEDGNPLPFPKQESSATWEERDATWIPVRVTSSLTRPDGTTVAIELDLSWERINVPIMEEDLFDPLKLPGIWDVRVLDKRGSRTIQLGRIESGVFVADHDTTLVKTELQVADENTGRSRLWWLLTLNAGIIVGLLAFIRQCRRRERHSASRSA